MDIEEKILAVCRNHDLEGVDKSFDRLLLLHDYCQEGQYK